MSVNYRMKSWQVKHNDNSNEGAHLLVKVRKGLESSKFTKN